MKHYLCLSLLLFIHQILAGPIVQPEEDQLERTGRTFSGNSTEDIFNDLSRLLQVQEMYIFRTVYFLCYPLLNKLCNQPIRILPTTQKPYKMVLIANAHLKHLTAQPKTI